VYTRGHDPRTEPCDPTTLAFDQYQRYTIVAQVAELIHSHLERPRLRVLDVGGLFRTRAGQNILPLNHFLPKDEVVVVDLQSAQGALGSTRLSCYALANGLALPFGTQTFDLVASCDTLEHVLPANRLAFIDELLRVADHYLVLIAPFDTESTRRAERILHDYLTAQDLRLSQLEEHLSYGLPSTDDVSAQLAEHGLAAVDFPDGYLPHWLALMIIKHTPSLSLEFQLHLDRYYNTHFSPYDRRLPAYRHAFVVAKPGYEALLPTVTDTLQSTQLSTFPDPSFAVDFGHLLRQSDTATLNTALREVEGQLAKVQTARDTLQAENATLRQLVASYERGRFIRSMRWLRALSNRLRGTRVHAREKVLE